MSDEAKAEILRYIASQIAIAKVKDLPTFGFVLRESEEFNFEDLIEISEAIQEKYKPSWVVLNNKDKKVRVKVVLK